jgi:transposase-like protein
MAAKKTTKGKRYTAEEKQSVVDFVNSHNEANGRGGVTAAVKKFGTSALTIATWVKGSGGSSAGNGRKGGNGTPASNRGGVLAELSKLDRVIAAKRKELDALEARFQKLKSSL